MVSYVGPNFFSTLQIPILAGRGFTVSDTATNGPVAVVNEALARKFFPNTNPIGNAFAVAMWDLRPRVGSRSSAFVRIRATPI